MNTLVNIREVALAGGTQAVAWGLQGVVSGRQLRQQVLAQARALAQLEAHTVALWLPQSDDFLITFLALALTGKHIVLPHTLQVGVGRQMAAHFDALITHTRQPAFNCAQYTPAELIEHGAAAPEGVYNCAQPVAITLFTSGSTGVPQTVHKTLAELEAEVAVLAHDFPHMGSAPVLDRKSTRLNSSHVRISYAVFCLKKKKKKKKTQSRIKKIKKNDQLVMKRESVAYRLDRYKIVHVGNGATCE